MTQFTESNEAEYERLQGSVAKIERMLTDITASSDVSNALETYLNVARLRLDILKDEKQTAEEEKLRRTDREHAAVLVEREVALSQQEREQYGSFLKLEYFTKDNFDSLETFYTNSYDKLTEGGKAQMSHRVWEGVRRDEYKFSELPEPVKDKEAQRLRDALDAGHKNLNAIPETDRREFIDTWDAGRKKESYKILDRPSFAPSVAVSAEVTPDITVGVQAVKADAVQEAMKAKTERGEKPAAAPELMGALEFKADDLADVSLCTPDIQPPLSGHKKSGGPPVRGG